MSYQETFGVNWNLLERSHETCSRLLTLQALPCQRRAICPAAAQQRAIQTAQLLLLQSDACQLEKGCSRNTRALSQVFRLQLRSWLPTSVGGDKGEPWSSDGFVLPGIGLSSPCQRVPPQRTWNYQPAASNWGAGRSPAISTASCAWGSMKGDFGGPRRASWSKGSFSTKIQNKPAPRKWGKNKNTHINLISHWGLLLVPKAALLCLALDSSDWSSRPEDKKQNLCLATAPSQEIALLCQKLNRDPTDMGT